MNNDQFFDPGALNHRLTLQSIAETADENGVLTVNWNDVAELWAAIRPVSSQDREIAQQIDEYNSHRIIVRFRTDIISGWRFMKGDREFLIKTVNDPDERQNYLVCSTREQGR